MLQSPLVPAPSPPVEDDLHTEPRADLGQLPADERFLTWGARFAAVGIAWVAVTFTAAISSGKAKITVPLSKLKKGKNVATVSVKGATTKVTLRK